MYYSSYPLKLKNYIPLNIMLSYNHNHYYQMNKSSSLPTTIKNECKEKSVRWTNEEWLKLYKYGGLIMLCLQQTRFVLSFYNYPFFLLFLLPFFFYFCKILFFLKYAINDKSSKR